ncbi:YqhA family protein [Hydrogenothermus marinus]|uniref:Putative membrane protein YqhA n=2 Tax=Hydrogenothermus marinus TaxID=133270 RepID=A0A3M0BRV8_9AQUI|nr:YqhA family protein [Hydrogenothermus marinus]RMB00261.1 putative membrane protein YqhA [Hydrogenothermus marinus]
MRKIIEQVVERILWESRFMIFLAVIASIIGAFILVLVGTYDIIIVLKDSFHAFSSLEHFEGFHKEAVKHIVSAVDVYLIATVLLIFGLGLYELFISKIDAAETNNRASKILVVHTLDQLKDKLAKVIVMVLTVTFFKFAIDFHYENIKTLLFLAVGILAISLSIYFLHKGGEYPSENNEKSH